MYSAVLIIPETLLTKANKLGEAMGWGPTKYTIHLKDVDDVSYYGLRTDVQPSFLELIQGVTTGVIPDMDLEAYELTPADVQEVVANLKADFSPDPTDPESPTLWGSDHFMYALNKYQMVRVE